LSHTRINPAGLRSIFKTELIDSDLQVFIDTSNLIVTEELGSSGLSDDRLKEIERFLAAHFATTADPQMQSERIGSEYQYRVQGQFGEGLKSTTYGQQVLLLDTTGLMAKFADGKKRASISAISEYDRD